MKGVDLNYDVGREHYSYSRNTVDATLPNQLTISISLLSCCCFQIAALLDILASKNVLVVDYRHNLLPARATTLLTYVDLFFAHRGCTHDRHDS